MKTAQGYDIVDGKLDLPDGAHVYKDLDLEGCAFLTSLPRGLNVGGSLDLSGCTSLKTLPDNLTVSGLLDIFGCTSLKALPEGLNVGVYLITDHFCYDPLENSLLFHFELHETVADGLTGMRVDHIVDHPWLRDLGLSHMTVAKAEINDLNRFLKITLAPALERAA